MARLKDEHKGHNHILEGLSPDMLAFNEELSKVFPKIRYTSGKRSASQKVGNYSKVSHHNTGNALDMGAEHQDVYNYLMNTKEGLQLLAKYELGVIDETDPETMKKTGATGKHYHIGKDSHYAKQVKQKLEGDVPEYQSTKEFRMSTPTQIEIMDGDGNAHLTYLKPEDLQKEVDRAKEKEEKQQETKTVDPNAQSVENKKQIKQAFLEEISNTKKVEDYLPQEDEEEDMGIPISEIELPEIVTSLPNMPNIFSPTQE